MSSNWQNVGTIRGPEGPKGEPGLDGIQGPAGVDGLGTWSSTTQINASGNTAAVVPVAVDGREPQVGDLVVSTHNNSLGLVGRVISVQSPASVTVVYVTSIRGAVGPQGDSVTGPAGSPGLATWSSVTQMNAPGGTAGIVPIQVTGRTPQVGDMVVSTHNNSLGFLGRITSVQSATSVTVDYVTSIRGAPGQEGPEGPPGAGVYIRGTFRDVTALPGAGQSPGETDFVRYQGQIYQWIAPNWVLQPGQPGHAYLDTEGYLWVWTGSSS